MRIEFVMLGVIIFMTLFYIFTSLYPSLKYTSPSLKYTSLSNPLGNIFSSHQEIVDKFTDYTDVHILNKIRNLLKDIHQLFEANNIKYMIDGGTLLGAVRHNDIIPWDDDGDIVIFNDDGNGERKLLSLTITLRNMGYGLSKFWGGYRIYYLNGEDISFQDKNWTWNNRDIEKIDKMSVSHKYPFVDIFFIENSDDLYIFSYKNVRDVWPSFYHNKSDVFPLQEYKFDSFSLLGPKNPEPYLTRGYGNDWKTVGYKTYDHKNQTFISPSMEDRVII